MLPTLFALLLAGQAAAPKTAATPPPMDAPFVCQACDEWNKVREPFRLHGNSYYVGAFGVSAVAIKTSAGIILLDGGLPQTAPLIEASLKTVGLRIEDVKFIMNSHAHYDHSGGIARLQKDSGAVVVASASGAAAIEAGRPVADDPQYGVDGSQGMFPSVAKVRTVKDGEAITLGDVTVTAHLTPGHTPGSTTWTWKSCDAGACLNLVYADSLNSVSLDGFRFSGDATHKDRSEQFRASIAKVAALPCDILVSVHPDNSGLFERVAKRGTQKADPLIDPGACRAYAKAAGERLDARLKTERTGAAK